MLLSAEQYFERHRTESGNLACDDHWFGSTTCDHLSMYPMSVPWYVAGQDAGVCLELHQSK